MSRNKRPFFKHGQRNARGETVRVVGESDGVDCDTGKNFVGIFLQTDRIANSFVTIFT